MLLYECLTELLMSSWLIQYLFTCFVWFVLLTSCLIAFLMSYNQFSLNMFDSYDPYITKLVSTSMNIYGLNVISAVQ